METLLYKQTKYGVVNKKPFIFELEALDKVSEHIKTINLKPLFI